METLQGLKPGSEFKNYRDFCANVGLEATTGDGKVAQLAQVGQYIGLQKIEGTNKYVVTQVYNEPKLIQQTEKRLPQGSYMSQAFIALCRLLLRRAQQNPFNQDLSLGSIILLTSHNTRFEMGYYSSKCSHYFQNPKGLSDDLNAGLNEHTAVSIPDYAFLERIDKVSRQSLDRTLNRLQATGAIKWKQEPVWFNETPGKEYGSINTLSEKDERAYNRLSNKIKNSDKFGGKINYYNRKEFYKNLEEEAKGKFGKKIYGGNYK